MALSEIRNRNSILAAVEEFDEIGRKAFLRKYGFGPARLYFLVIDGRQYDSKAIVGAAHGYEFSDRGPLESSDFSGGEKTVARKLRELEFAVHVIRDSDTPIVLVENEATVGGRYDDWKDVTGERYHFPNRYKNKMVPGRPFVYYRGTRRLEGRRGTPEYFGFGAIGEVWRDPDVSVESHKRNWKWFCEIEDYEPFSNPVPAKIDGEYLERIASNQWGVAVRELPHDAFERILELGGIGRGGRPDEGVVPEMPSIDDVGPSMVSGDESLMVIRPRGQARSPTSHGRRQSRHSKAIGDRAEEVIFKYLREGLSSEERRTLRWVASEGETPGWDIEYKDRDGQLIAIEVKGTKGSTFANVEFTGNEWDAAKGMRDCYWIYLVADCLEREPRIQAIKDPVGLEQSGQLSVTPLSWRIELTPT